MPESMAAGGQEQVIVEQLGRLADRIEARMKAVETSLDNYKGLEAEKIDNLKLYSVKKNNVVLLIEQQQE